MTPEIKAYIDEQLGRLRQALRSRAIYTRHGTEHLRGGRDFVPMLTVEEIDGSPTVAGVKKIKVTNATLTDDGDGVVSLAISSGTSAHDHTTGDGSGVLTADEHDSYSQYAEIAAPGTPAAGKVFIYPKSDGLMYVKDDAGVEREMGTVAHAAAADPHTGYRLESADHTHASTGAQAGALYSRMKYVNVPDAAVGVAITAGDAQGAILHSGPSAETADALEVDAETAPGASGLPCTWQYGDTNDLDTVASWTTIATYTLSSEKSNRTTSMTNATIPANRLIRTNWGTIVGTPKDATTTLHVKSPLTT